MRSSRLENATCSRGEPPQESVEKNHEQSSGRWRQWRDQQAARDPSEGSDSGQNVDALVPFREDDSMRTELFWIKGPWPGRLAIMPRPRDGDWLENEIQSWRRSGVDVVFSLLMADEM